MSVSKVKHKVDGEIIKESNTPDSVLLAGAGKRPPKGKPASPGTANGFVDRARSSRMAVRWSTKEI